MLLPTPDAPPRVGTDYGVLLRGLTAWGGSGQQRVILCRRRVAVSSWQPACRRVGRLAWWGRRPDVGPPRATIVGVRHWSLWAFVNSHNQQRRNSNYFLAAWERLRSTINVCALPTADSTCFSDQGRVRANIYAPKNEQYKETLGSANCYI